MQWNGQNEINQPGWAKLTEAGEAIDVRTHVYGCRLTLEQAREMRDALSSFIEANRKHAKQGPQP